MNSIDLSDALRTEKERTATLQAELDIAQAELDIAFAALVDVVTHCRIVQGSDFPEAGASVIANRALAAIEPEEEA